jgi:hypothetical protein
MANPFNFASQIMQKICHFPPFPPKTRQFQRFSAFCNEKNILGLGVN